MYNTFGLNSHLMGWLFYLQNEALYLKLYSEQCFIDLFRKQPVTLSKCYKFAIIKNYTNLWSNFDLLLEFNNIKSITYTWMECINAVLDKLK